MLYIFTERIYKPDSISPSMRLFSKLRGKEHCYSIISAAAGYNGVMFQKKTKMDIQFQNKDTFELNVEERLRPSVERKLTGTTKMDLEIESIPIPKSPFLIVFTIRLIRLYQKFVASKLGNRCVFEPSCSHYCEFVIREFGLIKGVWLTFGRLLHCKPGNGGVDLPPSKGEKNEL